MKSRYNPEVSIIVLYYEVDKICSRIRYSLAMLTLLNFSLIILSHYISLNLLSTMHTMIVTFILILLTLASFHHNLYKTVKPIMVFYIDRYVKKNPPKFKVGDLVRHNSKLYGILCGDLFAVSIGTEKKYRYMLSTYVKGGWMTGHVVFSYSDYELERDYFLVPNTSIFTNLYPNMEVTECGNYIKVLK